MGWRDWIPKDSAPMPEARRPPRERIPGGLAVSAPRAPATAGRAIARDPVRALSVEGRERAAIASEDGGLPRAYADAWAALQEGPPPGVPQERWARAVADAGAFLDEWGPRAAALGWSVVDLFDPPGRWAPGLVWALEGGAVALLTDWEAVFARDGAGGSGSASHRMGGGREELRAYRISFAAAPLSAGAGPDGTIVACLSRAILITIQ